MKRIIIPLVGGLIGTILGTMIGYEMGDYLLEHINIKNKDGYFMIDSMRVGGFIGGVGTCMICIYMTDPKNKFMKSK